MDRGAIKRRMIAMRRRHNTESLGGMASALGITEREAGEIWRDSSEVLAVLGLAKAEPEITEREIAERVGLSTTRVNQIIRRDRRRGGGE